ncbi:hypothetical protein T459_08512 [Capsicum annuum]|uniref:SWIM-type domain-containing protein n=1 Tax=Capsicum annuum TaxID=4072 RepID=A0A2G2ZWT0_CAPAN|nr:hypothetical protein T459_08512 [Capsicum annuum]
MSIAEFVLVFGDFMGEWVETPKCWKWKSFTKVKMPIPVCRTSSYDELIGYKRNAEQGSRLRIEQRDGLMPILRINVVEWSFKGPLNSSPPPPQCPIVDDDLNDYENDDDYLINMEDDSMHVKDVLLDRQDNEENCGMGSQPGYFFTGGTNFYCDQTFVDKKKLLDAATNIEARICLLANFFTHGKVIESRVFLPYHGKLDGWIIRLLLLSIRSLHTGIYLYEKEKAYNINEFSENFAELKINCPEAAHVLENMLSFEKWSRAHFLGNRKFGEKFRERHAFVNGKNNKFVPRAERILKDNKSASDSLYVTNANGDLDQFTVFGNDVIAKVNLLERSCSCQKFNLVKMLCEHVMEPFRAKYGDGVGYGNFIYKYFSPIYKAETYLLAYSEAINVVPLEA